MKPKLNPLILILGLFLFKVGIVDNIRFASSNGDNIEADHRVASLEGSRKAARR